VLVAALLAGAAAAAPRDAVVQQPRPFGYTVGDIATQRVLLAPDFTAAMLPEPLRANLWLERRPARIETAADGRRWLVVDYQVVNAPRTLANIPLPAWELGPALRVPATTISVAPLTAPTAPGEALPLRPERAAPAVPTEAMQRRLWAWLAALAATLAAWLAYVGWNAWRDRRTLPFSIAERELRTTVADPAAAHRTLHRAFDRTAGAVLHAGALAPLFQRAPWLRPLQPQIARFYADSAGLFFGAGLPPDALPPQALCRQLRRLERRNAP
jgi:mxaA protein